MVWSLYFNRRIILIEMIFPLEINCIVSQKLSPNDFHICHLVANVKRKDKKTKIIIYLQPQFFFFFFDKSVVSNLKYLHGSQF
jgi:hypothetical protein